MRGVYRLAAGAASVSILMSASPGAAQPLPGRFGVDELVSRSSCAAAPYRRAEPLRGAAGAFVLGPRMTPTWRNAAAGSAVQATSIHVACAGASTAGVQPAAGPLHLAGGPGAPAVACRGLIQFGDNAPKELHAWVTIRPDALDLRFASAGDSWRQSYRYTRTDAGDYSVRLPAGWMSYSPSQRVLRASMTSSYEADDEDPNNPYPVTYTRRISFRASCA